MSYKPPQYDENPFSGNAGQKKPIIENKSAQLKTPTWLQEQSHSTGNNSSSTSESQNNGNEVNPEVPKMILYTRIINLVLSICMMIVSLLSVLTTQSATTGVLACYVVVFSCLLCCFETHLKQVSKFIALNFGFMYSAKSRSFFMLFIGIILFSFSLFGKIIGILMLANAIFNFFILVKYPEYEDAQRNDAQSEIKDYLASNPAFAKKIFSAGVQAGSEIVKNNPELAKQGSEAFFNAATSSKSSTDSRGNYTSV